MEFPILNVGFGGGAPAELAADVSNAGGFGVVGGTVPVETGIGFIRGARELTTRPFGINLIIAKQTDPETADQLAAMVDAYVAEGVDALVLFWGDPAPYVPVAHAAGVKVLLQVGSVREAEDAAAAGVDAVILQGIEAGGHVKATESIWKHLPVAVDAVRPLPVIASGGIGDGAGIARALALGAQGVSLGTRFVASEEASVNADYRRRVVAARAEDTWYGLLFDVGWPGAPHRVLRNRAVDEWEAAGRPESGKRPGEGDVIGRRDDTEIVRYSSIMATAAFVGDVELASLWAGESCGIVNDVLPAGEIVRRLVEEFYSVTTYSNEAQQSTAKSTS
jgi:NAD(P)H-dependent flavin oxidoreductase YrpB (nitropropane dioxygenase family)